MPLPKRFPHNMSVLLNDEQYDWLKARAASTEQSYGEVLRALLQRAIDDERPHPSRHLTPVS